MLAQRRRRWANFETTLGQCLVFAGSVLANPIWTTIDQWRLNFGPAAGSLPKHNDILLWQRPCISLYVRLRQSTNNIMRIPRLDIHAASETFNSIIFKVRLPEQDTFLKIAMDRLGHGTQVRAGLLSWKLLKPQLSSYLFSVHLCQSLLGSSNLRKIVFRIINKYMFSLYWTKVSAHRTCSEFRPYLVNVTHVFIIMIIKM